MQLKACGHSYIPKHQKPLQLQSACARRGETFLSKAIRKCCLKHAVPKPTQPSFIISHHEPSGETFFQRPVARQPKHKNNRHAPNKCKKPQKRKTTAKTRQPFTSTTRSIVSSPTRISFITVQMLLAPLAFKNSATLAPGWAKLKCSQSVQSAATPSRPTRSGATEIV